MTSYEAPQTSVIQSFLFSCFRNLIHKHIVILHRGVAESLKASTHTGQQKHRALNIPREMRGFYNETL
jgi:hypothetical protein